MTICSTRRAPALLTSAAIIVALCAPRLAAAAQANNAQGYSPTPAPINGGQQRAHCDAQLRALKQTAGMADGQSDQAFMKTCLADVDPVAVLPGPAAVMNAPVGSTGVCKDGTYSSAVRRDGACRAHGGLSRWFGQ